MMSQYWITIVSLLISQAFCQDLTVADVFSSPSFPELYKDEMATMKCRYTMSAEDFPSLESIFLTKGTGSDIKDTGCTRKTSLRPGQLPAINAQDQLNWGMPTVSQCEELVNTLETDGSVEITFRFPLDEAAPYQCTLWTGDAINNIEPLVTIAELKEAPQNLTMEIANTLEENGVTVTYLGDTVTAVCNSVGGNPAADFEYGVLVGDEDRKVDSFTDVEMTKSDNGNQIYCRDLAHPNLLGGDNAQTYMEKTLTVYWFMKTGQLDITHRSVNPSATDILECSTDRNLRPGAFVSYLWTKDGVPLDEEGERLVVSLDIAANETISEMYTCTATVVGDERLNEPVSYKFNVTWDVATSTPTTTTTTPKATTTKELVVPADPKENTNNEADPAEKDPTVVIIIVVVVVTVIILIIVIVIIVIKRRNTSSADASKQASAAPQKGDAEQGNGDAEAAAKPLLEKQNSNKSE